MLRHAEDGSLVWSFGTTCNSVDSRRRFSAMPVISQRTSGYLGNLLVVQANLAVTYHRLKMYEQALSLKLDVYSGMLRLHGEEHHQTLGAALNYANTLLSLRRFEEAKALLRKTIPVTRRALGENEEATLRMRWCFARALYGDDDATLDDLRGAVATLEELERIARRVFGGAHPLKVEIERELRRSRAKLRARETPPTKGES